MKGINADKCRMQTYPHVTQGRLQAGKASLDSRCHDTEYKQADSTDIAPAPHTKFQIHASTVHNRLVLCFTSTSFHSNYVNHSALFIGNSGNNEQNYYN